MTNDGPLGQDKADSPILQWGHLPLWKETWSLDSGSVLLRNYALAECWIDIFRALLDEMGPLKTLEAIKPINLVAGKALVGSEKIFGPRESDLEKIVLSYYIWHCGTSMGNLKPVEIRDGKAIVEVYACPVTTELNAPPEFCVAESHIMSEGLCQAINPEYEFVWTHHLGNGDDRCRYIVKKRSDKLLSGDSKGKSYPFAEIYKAVEFDPDQLGILEKTISLKFSEKEMLFLSLGVVYGGLGVFTTASVNAIGSQRTIELGAPYARNTGLKVGTKLMEGVEGPGDLLMLNSKFDYLCSIFNMRGEPSIASDSHIEKEVSTCPFKNYPFEVCKHMESMFNGVCEAINPDYEFVYDRMMSKGDPTCYWMIRKKVASPSDDSSSEILKKRFARGEISKEDYLEMKVLLEE